MNKILERKVYWITGSAVALAGVVAVRLIAPGLSGVLGKAVMISGYVASLAGILIIACCTKDRAIAMKNEWTKTAPVKNQPDNEDAAIDSTGQKQAPVLTKSCKRYM